MRGISILAEDLLDPKEGLRCLVFRINRKVWQPMKAGEAEERYDIKETVNLIRLIAVN